MFASLALTLVGLNVGLVGCAQPRPYDKLWVPPRDYASDLEAIRPPTHVLGRSPAIEPDDTHQNPTGELTMRDAVALALRLNPGLRAAGWSVTASEADAMQFGRPPNPRVSFSVENFAGPDVPEPVFERQTLRLSQVIELADKRAKRRALGEAEQRLSAWDYESARLRVAADAALRFVAVLVSQERLALSSQRLELDEQAVEIVRQQVDAGSVASTALDRAQARVALGRIARVQALQQLRADQAELAAVWGGEQARFGSVAGDLNKVDRLPPLSELRALLDQSPEVARWSDEVVMRERAVAVQRAKGVPDPTAGVGLRYFPDADEVAGVAELSVPLNVFDDNRSGILAARMRLARAKALGEQARADAASALSRAHAHCESMNYTIDQYDREALPALTSAYEGLAVARRSGAINAMPLIEAEQALIDLRLRRLDALLSHHQMMIEIERLTGQPLRARPSE